MQMTFEIRKRPETPNPVRQFNGISPWQVLRRKPKSWRVLPAFNGLGWKMIDENGLERIRFMRPQPRASAASWTHIRTGYWIVRDAKGNWLDGDGNIVARSILFRQMTEDQKFRIHIPFTGIVRELELEGETATSSCRTIRHSDCCTCIVCTSGNLRSSGLNPTWRERRALRLGKIQMPPPLEITWKANCSCDTCKQKKEAADDHIYWRDRRPLRHG